MLKKLRKRFISGALITLPIALTIYFVLFIVNFFDKLVFESFLKGVVSSPIPGLGLVILALLMILVGSFAGNYLGRLIVSVGEVIFRKIPIVKTIYSTIKQILDTIFADTSTAFQKVVLVEYPKEGAWVIGFVTADTPVSINTKINSAEGTTEKYINLFVPTTPNPTSGFLIMAKESKIVPLDITPDLAMKIIISGGVLNCDNEEEAQEKINKYK